MAITQTSVHQEQQYNGLRFAFVSAKCFVGEKHVEIRMLDSIEQEWIGKRWEEIHGLAALLNSTQPSATSSTQCFVLSSFNKVQNDDAIHRDAGRGTRDPIDGPGLFGGGGVCWWKGRAIITYS